MKIIGKYILRIILFLILISSILYLHLEKLKKFLLNKSNSQFHHYFCYNYWNYLHLETNFHIKKRIQLVD